MQGFIKQPLMTNFDIAICKCVKKTDSIQIRIAN